MRGRGRVLWLLGALLASGARGQDADPFAGCERALAEAPAGFEPAKCFYQVARERNLWQEARRRLLRQQQIHPELPWLRFYRASLAMDLGEGEAEGLFRDAADAFAESGDAAGETYSRINRARLLEGAGRLQEALEEAGRAKSAAASGSDSGLVQEVRMLELRFRYLLGDERVALQRDLQALEQALREDSSYGLRRDVTNYLAATAFDLGEYREALGHYEASAARARDAGDTPTVAAVELSALHVALAQRTHDGWSSLALARAERALDAAIEAGVPYVEASARLTLGRLTEGAGGDTLLEEGLAIASRLAAAELERDALGYLALRRLDDPRRALALIDASLEAALRSDDPLGPAAAWHEQLAVRWNVSGRDAALAQAAEILDAIERLSRSETSDTGSARMFSVWAEAYYWIAGRLFTDFAETGERELLEEAFSVLERMRARLLEPQGASASEGRELASLADTEAELSANEALISIQLGQDRNAWGLFAGGAWLTVSTRHGTELYPLPQLADLEPRIAMLLALLERRDGSEEAAARVVHENVLAEAVASLPLSVDHLILVPDGLLHLVPFAALRDAGGDLLGDRYELSEIPSVTVWRRLRRLEDPRPGAGVLAVIDPLAGAAPAEESGLRTWLPRGATGLGPLRFARREGRAIRRSFGTGCRLLEGAGASEGSVRAEARGSKLIHFATHALIDSRSPERSAVVLARGRDDDGLLSGAEIAALSLPGPLVVLSTCESAGGPLLRGEGVMSLARSFFRGGARTVVASLWRLRDREAAELFDRFYRHLGRGVSVSRALHAAQRDLVRAGAPANAWAGLTVLGDGAWVPFPAGTVETRHWPRLAAGLAGLVLLAWLAISLARRRQ